MSYLAGVLMVALSLTSISYADAAMSPAVKAHLCKLAKRDAALSPVEVEAIRQARAECLAAPPELSQTVTKCKTRVYGNVGKTKCTSTQEYIPKNCPPDYPATAEKRIAEYCTDE